MTGPVTSFLCLAQADADAKADAAINADNFAESPRPAARCAKYRTTIRSISGQDMFSSNCP